MPIENTTKIYLLVLKIYLYVCDARILKIITDVTDIPHKTETKIRGRHKVESTSVLSKHLFRSSRSDLPSLFNSNSFIMREQMDNSTNSAADGANRAKKIIQEFIYVPDEAGDFRDTLTEIFFEWVRSDLDYSKEDRCLILSHYRRLMDFLNDIEGFLGVEKLERERRVS